MVDFKEQEQRYWQLLHQPESLFLLHRANDVEHFIVLMADFLAWPELSLEHMLAFIALQQETFIPDLDRFSQAWLPCRYQSQHKTVSWVPALHKLSKPFLEDDISDARHCLLASFIQPKTLLAPLLSQRESLPIVNPSLMIFHWSRCGSTLLSSSFALLETCRVLSESMLCSDVMHDDHWPLALKPQLVDLCLRLQGRLRLGERELVIKWNAWDLACWPMLLELYPKSRVLCLIRNPKDIIASHQRVAGRHMAGGQSLLPTELHTQQMENTDTEPSLDEFRTTVLQNLAQLSVALHQSSRAILLDYHQLKDLKPTTFSTILGWPLSEGEIERWQHHWRFDAKQQGQLFTPVVPNEPVPIRECQSPSWQQLLITYNQLLQRLYWDKKA
ncbi:sulfotransferase domain-containing protein [Shewanella sp. SR1]|uniref:sulfotransferase domain-containing protein n=1 Tax=Shewanella sp. SR1 TaxID=2855505 RepID=UPI001CF22687|nr:sulfotransferase domain-containing protein [Shewanella sp. SR1]MCB2384394.1 sulfotransferase domain-containing protein [Shewanella sp. SR1]